MLNTQVATKIVHDYNECIHSVDETNAGLTYCSPVRHDPLMIQHRNRILGELMNHQSHQAEY